MGVFFFICPMTKNYINGKNGSVPLGADNLFVIGRLLAYWKYQFKKSWLLSILIFSV